MLQTIMYIYTDTTDKKRTMWSNRENRNTSGNGGGELIIWSCCNNNVFLFWLIRLTDLYYYHKLDQKITIR